MEIKQILDELKEKTGGGGADRSILASRRSCGASSRTSWTELAEKFGDKRRTRLGSAEEITEFDRQAYIVRENTNVVLTRDGWIKRVGRLASVESTRVREGDEVIAVVPGSTLDHVVFFADDGLAYTMRDQRGAGVVRLRRADDQVFSSWATGRIVAA